MPDKMPTALCLFSGGLDSILATALIKEQGIKVKGIHFILPFAPLEREDEVIARKQALRLNISLEEIDISNDFLEFLKEPRFGYGRCMNPCIDCRILMFSRAREYIDRGLANFVISGEVLGERPMSQRRDTMNIIDRESGMKGLILRPLSAKLLPPTLPELNGWVDRDKLMDINGRSRKPQMERASKLKITNYPTPAGGCLLTDPGFSQRLKDSMEDVNIDLNWIALLKIGRHFRLSDTVRAIIARNEKENHLLEDLARDNDFIFEDSALPGPLTLLRTDKIDKDLIKHCAQITARYGKAKGKDTVISYYKVPQRVVARIKIGPIDENDVNRLRV